MFVCYDVKNVFVAKSEDVTPVECLTGTIVNTTGKQELQLLPESCHDKLNYYACKVYKPSEFCLEYKSLLIQLHLRIYFARIRLYA